MPPSTYSARGACGKAQVGPQNSLFTVQDLARFAVGLNHAKPLGRAGLELSWTPVRLNNGGSYPYGLGWNIVEQRGYRRIGHSGTWRGFHATFQRYPDFDLTVIVLLNQGQANSNFMNGVGTVSAGLNAENAAPSATLEAEATAQERCGSTQDHRDAVEAFVSKSEPNFHGR